MKITIPRGSVGFIRAPGLIAKFIMFFSRKFENVPEQYNCSHAFLYFDNGIIHESTVPTNQVRQLSKYFGAKYELYIYHNKAIREDCFNKGWDYSNGALGRLYDFPVFFGFPGKYIKLLKPLIWALGKIMPDSRYMNVCSELVAEVVRLYWQLPWVTHIKDDQISPAVSRQWVEVAGIHEGWSRVLCKPKGVTLNWDIADNYSIEVEQ